MPSGIRATVSVSGGDVCPIADLSATAETTIDSVATSVRPDEGAACVREFTLEADHDPSATFTQVFGHGGTERYRFARDDETDCPCACLGEFGCPVTRYVASEGELTLVFHAADYDELRTVVGALRDRFPDIDIERFVRSPAEGDAADGVYVDRRKLTARQREVLETAFERGYFERPRRANARAVADELDIDPSTFSEHLAAAESKILEDFL